MPFNSSGVYTPPDGAEDAVPGEVIRSATWNAIFTDISNALTQLGQYGPPAAPRIITAIGNITIGANDSVILIEANVPVITFPLSSLKTGPVKIFGAAGGIFSIHNSLLTPSGSDTISGLATVNLTADYQTVTLYPLVSGGYILEG